MGRVQGVGKGQKDSSVRRVAVAMAALILFSAAPALADMNLLPAAHAGLDNSGSVGQALGFSGNASHDPDGSIVSYSWSFGDGATATGSYVTHAYAATGTYTVTLTVTDDDGGTGTDTATAFVCPSVRNAIDSVPAGSFIQLQPCNYVERVTVNKSVTIRGGPGVVFNGSVGQVTPRSGPVFTIAATNVTLENLEIRRWQGTFLSASGALRLRLRNITAIDAGDPVLSNTGNVLIERSNFPTAWVNLNSAQGVSIVQSTINHVNLDSARGFRVAGSDLQTLSAFGSPEGVLETSRIGGASFFGNVSASYVTFGLVGAGGPATIRNSVVDGHRCCSSTFNGVTVERTRFTTPYDRYVAGTGTILRYNEFYAGTTFFQGETQSSFAYLNNFYGGHVVDNGFNNRFDTGSLGNYWSNHTAPDANGDGVRDSPRNISGSAGSADLYPLVSPFGGIANVTELPPDVTAAPEGLVDANRGVRIPMAGLVENITYDLTISNITPAGVGFGYGVPSGSGYGYGGAPSGAAVSLVRPDGIVVSTQTSYADAIHAGKLNVTYPAVLLGQRGLWSLVVDDFAIATFMISPQYFAPTSAPNPTAASDVAFDVQDMRVSFPLGYRIQVQAAIDLTFTNITTGSGAYALHAPNGTLITVATSYSDGLHPDRLNATFPTHSFAVPGTWTLRFGNTTVAAFDVEGPAGVAPFFADLQLSLGPRSDNATFGAAANATSGFDLAYDVAEPPAPADPLHVRLYFNGPNGTELHRSVLSSNGTLQWNITAGSAGANGTATLSWNPAEIAAVTSTYDVELLDGNTTIDMRLSSSHSFALNGVHALSTRVRQTAGLRLEANAVLVTPVVRVGTGLHVNGSLTNDGPETATDVSVTLELDNGTSLTVAGTPSVLPAGGVATFNFGPIIQTVPGDHTATIRVSSGSADSNLANNVVTKPYFVSTFLVDLEVVGGNVTDVGLSNVSAYTLQISNLGNTQETFQLALTGTPSGWAAALPASAIVLGAGANTTLTLNVTAPSSVTAEPRANITVEAIAISDPAARDLVRTRTTLVVERQLALPEGWSLVSIPVSVGNASASSILGPTALAVYEWTGSSYATASQLVAGRGYWVYSNASVTRAITGMPERNVSLALAPGWNLVGAPIAETNLSGAPANVSRTVFTWNATGYDESEVLLPLKGYWVYAHNASASLRIGVGAALDLRLPTLSTPSVGDFRLDVAFGSTSGSRDRIRLGASSGAAHAFDAADLPKMPASFAADSIRATSLAPDGANLRELHRDVHAPSAHHAWTLRVDHPQEAGDVVVRWDREQVARIPLSYRVELQDGPLRIDMRTVSEHTLLALGPGEHDLRVVVSSYLGRPVCAASLDGACVAWLPVDPTTSVLGRP